MIRDNIPSDRDKAKPLPERDDRPANKQGLFRKFNVTRVDGQDETVLDKHYNCAYFVLDLTHDPAALPALAAYADAVDATHPYLARDLRIKYLGVK